MLTVSSISDISRPPGSLPFAVDGFERLRRPIWVFDDTRKRKVYANRAALDLWGAQTLSELLERDFADQSPAVRMRMDAIRDRILRGETVEDRWTFYPKGAPVAVRTTISAVTLTNGRLGMLFEGDLADIGEEEHRAVEALRHTPVLVALFDRQGRRLFGNPAAMAVIPAPSFVEAFVEAPAGEALWRAALAGEPAVGSHRLITVEGERWHSIDLRRTRDPVSGEPCLLVNSTDITREVESREALDESRERAEDAVRARQAFLANMSHELRTPLTSVIGFAGLLADTDLSVEQRGRLDRIQDAGSALMATLNDVLDLSKLEAGGVTLSARPFHLSDLLVQAAGIVEVQA